jgi:FdhD protein
VNVERPGRTVEVNVVSYDDARARRTYDDVVTEEPLELRLVATDRTQTLAVTMRTPGGDFELAAGFVWSERIVRSPDEITNVGYCLDPAVDLEQRYNIVNVELRSHRLPDLARFERHFTINSSCGVCGRANLEALRDLGIAPLDSDVRVPIDVVYSLPERMREAQRVFASTGGLHAAALFDDRGQPLAVREDVGRHNAVDKIVGWGVLAGGLPANAAILMVSGRASYEILQKAAAARIPIVASVSAPSSLAVDLAREFNITLAGFVRGTRANVYSSTERITPAPA